MSAVAALAVWEESMHVRTLSAVLLLLNGMAFGADIPALQNQETFVETYRPAARISAARVVTGVMLVTSDAHEGPSAHAVVPSDWEGDSVCARWLSSDARYEASAQYLVSASGRPVQLQFESKHEELLKSLPRDQLGITVTRGACDAPSSVYAPVIWNGQQPWTGDTLVVLVHARGADEVYLVFKGPRPNEEGERYSDCDRLEHEYSVGIDHKCEIPTSEFDSARLEIELNRLRRGLPDDPIPFSIEMAIQE